MHVQKVPGWIRAVCIDIGIRNNYRVKPDDR
jgi:hypothetical protein